MVLHPITATRISSETLREIRALVFRSRESTLVEQADRYAIHDLEVTLLSTRRDMRLLLETLPEAAFTAQSADDTPAWSVGEIIAHLRHAQVNIFLRAARLAAQLPASREVERPDEDGVHPVRDRAESLAILDDADRDLLELFESLPDTVEAESTIQDDLLGSVSAKSALLFLAIHDDDHLGQLQELGNAHAA